MKREIYTGYSMAVVSEDGEYRTGEERELDMTNPSDVEALRRAENWPPDSIPSVPLGRRWRVEQLREQLAEAQKRLAIEEAKSAHARKVAHCAWHDAHGWPPESTGYERALREASR